MGLRGVMRGLVAAVVAAGLTCAVVTSSHAVTTYNFIDLGTLPAGSNSEGKAINASMRVTGVSQVTIYNGYHAYCRRSGDNMLDLGTLDGDDWWKTSYGYDINASGQVTGRSGDTGSFHPFLWTDLNGNFQKDAGEMTDLGTLGGSSGIGYGVNDPTTTASSSAPARCPPARATATPTPASSHRSRHPFPNPRRSPWWDSPREPCCCTT